MHNFSEILPDIIDIIPTTGPLPYSMTNDYVFRAVLQMNNKVLKGLICSLLHLNPEEVISVTITNPIELGKAIDTKSFFLDIKVILNNHTLINLEMQVGQLSYWPERSLSYLCRSFDNLNKGQDYSSVSPAIHIGFLDFTLFPENPEFYATYKFINVKNYSVYSDKLMLSVVDLTKIHMATEEDKNYKIDYWAVLFKATTWEEIQMIAKESTCFKEASRTLYEIMQDENVRLQCEARAEYERTERKLEKLKAMERKIVALETTIGDLNSANEKLTTSNRELESSNRELKSSNQELKSSNRELESSNSVKDNTIEKLEAQIRELKKLVEG